MYEKLELDKYLVNSNHLENQLGTRYEMVILRWFTVACQPSVNE